MKTALLGAWHVHAPQYLAEAIRLTDVVGVYEENPTWRHEIAERFHIPEFPSFEALLDSEAEAVIVCSATNRHADDIVQLACRKKAVFTEKVLALSEQDCLRVKQAVEENGVRFVISFPQKTMPGPLTVKSLLDAGAIGEVNYLRFRNCHSGSVNHWLPAHFYNLTECGGGAMIDLGAHGMYLIDWLLGEPEKYLSAFTHACRDEKDAEMNPDGIEDNAVTVMTYQNGTIAVNETGFVSVGCPMSLEVGGSRGYITWRENGPVCLTSDGAAEEIPQVAPADLPIISFLKGETPAGCGIDEAVTLTRMMTGAYRH